MSGLIVDLGETCVPVGELYWPQQSQMIVAHLVPISEYRCVDRQKICVIISKLCLLRILLAWGMDMVAGIHVPSCMDLSKGPFAHLDPCMLPINCQCVRVERLVVLC